jgi:two-component system, chemotaxis family, protein-glutamate methylesterase/glutaminase
MAPWTQHHEGGHLVVALITSAGGLDALTYILAQLPADLPAAILIAQHTNPQRDHHLAAILDKRTELTVRDAENGQEITAGTVLVAPARHHLLVTPDQRVALIECGSYPPARPSGDLLLTTLATAVGRGAVAVVLTGAGHDAATGATAIHHFGGFVITSDARTSQHFSMPHATINRDDAVDLILPLDQIGDTLHQLATAPTTGTSENA